MGMKVLTPFRGSKERAAFLRDLLGSLKEQGMNVEQIIGTKEGEVLAADEAGGSYLLKDLVAGEECSTRRPEQMRAAVEALARLHLGMDGCAPAVPEFMSGERTGLTTLYGKHERELVKVKNYVKSRSRKNEFEMKFQKEYPHFAAQAKRSVELLSEREKQNPGKSLCHGDFNQHNVIWTGHGWQIINFENVCCGCPVSDLANFLRKMMEKNDWEEALGMNLICAYDKIRPISGEEYRQLYMLLLFPEKFWKLANHYYNSHKAWISTRNIEKLDKMMEQEERREEFLENLFSNIRESCILEV
jgi:CotS family spore coat protein